MAICSTIMLWKTPPNFDWWLQMCSVDNWSYVCTSGDQEVPLDGVAMKAQVEGMYWVSYWTDNRVKHLLWKGFLPGGFQTLLNMILNESLELARMCWKPTASMGELQSNLMCNIMLLKEKFQKCADLKLTSLLLKPSSNHSNCLDRPTKGFFPRSLLSLALFRMLAHGENKKPARTLVGLTVVFTFSQTVHPPVHTGWTTPITSPFMCYCLLFVPFWENL